MIQATAYAAIRKDPRNGSEWLDVSSVRDYQSQCKKVSDKAGDKMRLYGREHPVVRIAAVKVIEGDAKVDLPKDYLAIVDILGEVRKVLCSAKEIAESQSREWVGSDHYHILAVYHILDNGTVEPVTVEELAAS